jgi:hypothetical protein
MIHELKLRQPFYDDVLKGDKTFEVRQNDRDFHVGDYLALNEFVVGENGLGGKYTGNAILTQITYILDNSAFCKDGCVILGIKKCSPVGGIWGELKNIRTNEEQGGGQ